MSGATLAFSRPLVNSGPNKNHAKTILSLCDYTGNWSAPYHAAGYSVIQVDPKLYHFETERLFQWRATVADVLRNIKSLPDIHGILAAPPCTHFTKAGNRFWDRFDANGETAKSIGIVEDILSIVEILHPTWLVLENPAGRIRTLVPSLGQPIYSFNPCDFGHPWTKLTYLWGRFVQPLPLFLGSDPSVEPTENNYIQRIVGSGETRRARRSETPTGFASAFFEVNK